MEGQLIPAGTLVTVPDPLPVVATLSDAALPLNIAVTVVALVSVTVHVPVPVHPPPLHPTNVDPPDGAAVSVTTVPELYASVQSAPQLIPAGVLVTVPVPVPALATVSVYCWSVNIAVTDVAAFTVTVHGPVPLHAPLHPAKVDPELGVAVSVTVVPKLNTSEQSAPQLIPAGELDTVPDPVPVFTTVIVNCCNVNVAVTVVAAVMVTVHGPVPVQPPPLHPVNDDPTLGDAVSVTTVPAEYTSEQSAPQLIPAGELVTVPDPVPDFTTVRVCASARAITPIATIAATAKHSTRFIQLPRMTRLLTQIPHPSSSVTLAGSSRKTRTHARLS